MISISWPSDLPTEVQVEGWSHKPASGVIRSSVDGAPARQRRRFNESLADVSLSWWMTGAQVKSFRSFCEDTVGFGGAWFSIDLPLGSTREVRARFNGDNPPQWSYVVPDLWLVQAQLDVIDPSPLSPDAINLLNRLPWDELQGMLAALTPSPAWWEHLNFGYKTWGGDSLIKNISPSNWNALNGSIADSGHAGPDNVNPSLKFTEDSSDNFHGVFHQTRRKPAAVQKFYASIYVKAVGSRNVAISINNSDFSAWADTGLDLSTGEVFAGNFDLGSFKTLEASAVLGANGFWLYTTEITTDADTGLVMEVDSISGTVDASHVGDGSSGFEFWGGQLRQLKD